MLYERYPRWSEGQLTRARSAVVSRDPMVHAATRVGIGEYLRLGKAEEEQGGRSRPSILSSAFEAVIAAVYLTSGMEAASSLIEMALGEELEAVQSAGNRADFKTRLQERCQADVHLTPIYHTVGTAGPDHDRVFTAEVRVADELQGRGTGKSKKDAEQEAAREALERLGSPPAMAFLRETPPSRAPGELPAGDGASSVKKPGGFDADED